LISESRIKKISDIEKCIRTEIDANYQMLNKKEDNVKLDESMPIDKKRTRKLLL
jgi:hypothetical protein